MSGESGAQKSPISGLPLGPRVGDELHAVRFPHATGMIFTEPLPLTVALKIVDRLRGRGVAAAKVLSAPASDTQPVFTAADWAHRQVLYMPGIGTVAFVRVPADVLMPGQADPQLDDVFEPTPYAAELLRADQAVRLSQESSQVQPVGWLAWTIYIVCEALWTAGGVACWIATVPAPPRRDSGGGLRERRAA